MDTIDRIELAALLNADVPVRLIMVLGPDRFRMAHIPGSETFATVDEALADLQPYEHIVVYCSGPACPASRSAYGRLVPLGYRHVRWYAGGLEDWQRARSRDATSGPRWSAQRWDGAHRHCWKRSNRLSRHASSYPASSCPLTGSSTPWCSRPSTSSFRMSGGPSSTQL